jgi:integrase
MTNIIDLTAVRQDRAEATDFVLGLDRAGLRLRYPGLNPIEKGGKLYLYHRATKIAIKARPIGSPEFDAEYKAAEDKGRRANKPKPGTLALCFDTFHEAARFKRLAPRTKAEYEAAMAYAREAAEHIDVVKFTPRDVIAMIERCAEKKWRKFANDLYCVVKLALDEAILDDVIKKNPARVKGVSRIPRPRNLPVANRVWFPDERKVVLDEAKPFEALKLVASIVMYTGMRHGDALKLSELDYDGVCIRFAQNKTEKPMRIPVHPALKAILDPVMATRREARAAGRPIPLRLVVGVGGQPYTETGFHTMWQRFIRRLKAESKVAPHITLHGLRHSAAVCLAEAGASQEMIRALLGHKSFRASHIYTAQAKEDGLIAEGVDRLYPEDRPGGEHDSN